MKKTKKTVSAIIICLCVILQMTVFAFAANETPNYDFEASLDNWQNKSVIYTGVKTATDQFFGYVHLKDGTANYIYVSMFLNGATICDGWAEVPKGNQRVKVFYIHRAVAGDTLVVKAYQKNIASKTAKGYITL